MKKIAFILAVLIVFSFTGCTSTGGGGARAEPYIVDLSTLPSVKNTRPFTRAWEDFRINLPDFPIDYSQYSRLTITVKYYDASNAEIPQNDSNCMVSVIYDARGDIWGPQMGPGPNTPVKEFNVGGYSGFIHTDRGIRVTFKHPPEMIMFQNNEGSDVAYIELTGLIFHNGNYSSRR